MRTMFVKLFLWFWLAMTLSGATFFLLAFTMRIGPLDKEHRLRFMQERAMQARQTLEIYGKAAALLHERGDQAAIGQLTNAAAPGQLRAYLFTRDGRGIGAQAPDPVRQAAINAVSTDASGPDRHNEIIVIPFTTPAGGNYIVAAEIGMPPPPDHGPPPGIPGAPFLRDFWFHLITSFVIGGLVCYILAWRLTAPIRQLRTATQRLAAGVLSSRVELNSRRNSEEITGLGQDFNLMGERIEKLLTAQKQLVRDISHELRSPLTRLSVALGLARREATPATENALNRIELETDRLNSMIGDLLTLSLMENSDQQLHREPLNLADMIAELIHDADFEAIGSDKRVQLDACENLPLISGNREQLRHAIENVIRNAIRYTAPRTTVQVNLHYEADSEIIAIRDHGPGVPEEALASIFTPFYRVEQARDRQSGGTGIGLAITAQTVALHQGTVTARNHPAGGLLIEIRLPMN